MRRETYALVVAMFGLCQHSAPVLAHHSFAAEFDAQKPVTLQGVVVKWEMINPHGWITLGVTAADGTTMQWMVETSNPNGLMRLGWTSNALKPGDPITVEGYLAKDGSSTANASRITLPDGSKVFAGSRTTPNPPPAAASAELAVQQAELPRLSDGRPDLQGLWLKSNGGFQGLFIGSLDGTNFAAGGGRGGPPAPQYKYTPEAAAEKEYRAQRSYEDPEGRCHVPGVPRALDQPAGLYPVQIIQDENYVALLHEAMHDVRIIPTDHSAHPSNYWAWDGDSRGRWEGDTFVVDVSNFNGRTWLDMQGNFVDENEHVLERFTLVDRDTILYEATVTDPTVFLEPVEFRFTLKRVPAEQQMLEYSCLEGERSRQHFTEEDGGKQQRTQ